MTEDKKARMEQEIAERQELVERLQPLVEADREVLDWLVAIALKSGAYLVLADGEVDTDTAYEVMGHVHAVAQALVKHHRQELDRATLL